MITIQEENYAHVGLISCTLLLVWLCGTIIFGKTFSYIHIGHIYITEMILLLLIINNIQRLNILDFIFIGLLTFYLIIGWRLHGSLFFAGKDMAWYYYLLFLRFFPRNFPNLYIKIVIIITIFVFLIIFIRIFFPELYEYSNKYRIGILLFFLYTLIIIFYKRNINIITIIFFFICASLTTFKTAIFLSLIFPFFIIYYNKFYNIFKFKFFIIFIILLIFLIYFNLESKVLIFFVQKTNLLILNKENTSIAINTALWRSELWTKATHFLFKERNFLLGDFPGHNFMKTSILGLDFNLEGGEQLGIVRSVHNIIIQIFMKTGLIGLVIWFIYYFLWTKELPPILVIFQISVLILAMTADILEVPSRGPLYFSYLVVLEIILKRKSIF